MTTAGGFVSDKRREAAQIGIEQRGLDGLADIAPQRRRQHPRRAAPAEIGFERRRQGGACREHRQRCGGKARGLAQLLDLVAVNGRGPIQASDGPSGLEPIVSSWISPPAMPREPLPAGIVGGCHRRRQRPARRKPKRLDHLAALRAPQPGAPRDQRMRNLQRQRAGRERQAIGDQMRAEFGEQTGRRPGSRRRHRRARRASRKAA